LITATQDSEGGIRLELNLLAGEVRDDIELVQHYGVSSRPKKDSQAVILFLGGSRDSGVAIATKGMGPEMRIELKEGEVALHTDEGDFIHLKNGRVMELSTETLKLTATKEILIDSPQTTSTGEVADFKGTLDRLRQNYNTATYIGNLGAPTSTTSKPDQG
jgi:phage baseplate assembly protein V